jgi:acetyltransferase-like isoleucine patch superfamily enzyme
VHSRKAGSVQQQLTAPGSMLSRYRHTVLENSRWSALMFYELNEFFIQPLRGSMGYYLRSLVLPRLVKKMGPGVRIGANVAMRRPGRISLGPYVVINESVTLNVKDNGESIVLGENVEVGMETIFSCIGGNLNVGRGTLIGRRCRLGSKMGLEVGISCRIGNNTYIVGASHAHNRLDTPIIDQAITCKGPSRIGDYVQIGENVTILDGVCIGDNVQVASGSLVNQDIDDNIKVSGVPARRIKEHHDEGFHG